jgi:hypothetical protein
MRLNLRSTACCAALFVFTAAVTAQDARYFENGCPVEQCIDYTGNTNQHWRFVPVGGGWHKIVLRASGKCLEADPDLVRQPGCPIILWDDTGEANQHWRLRQVDEGVYAVESRASGLVIGVPGDRLEESGAQLVLMRYRGQDNQQWEIRSAGRDWRYLTLLANGFVWDAVAE